MSQRVAFEITRRADDLAIGQLHPNGLAVLYHHLGDPRFVADGAAVALQALHQFFGDHTHPLG